VEVFDYAVVPVTAVRKLFLLPPENRGEAQKENHNVRAVQNLLRRGFRWVRTEGTLAIFEKTDGVYSYTVDAEHYLGLTN